MKLFPKFTLFLPALFVSLLSNSVLAGFEDGIAAYQANDLPLAYKEFREAAENGHVDSQYNLALMYEKGIGTAKDEKEATVWYRKAAARGNTFAQYNLAVMYENGRGTPVDYAQAHDWYRKAVAQGDPLAIGNLGMLYARGEGVRENSIAGLALLLLSATMDTSPENTARQNIASMRGLSSAMIAAAQALSAEMGSAGNVLAPLDNYLRKVNAVNGGNS